MQNRKENYETNKEDLNDIQLIKIQGYFITLSSFAAFKHKERQFIAIGVR